MTKIESEKAEIPNSINNVYAFLSDFNNFQKLMPSQVTNWQSTTEECSFTINGMATIGMKIIGKTPPDHIHIVSNGKVPFNFDLYVNLQHTGEHQCQGQLVFSADLNPMIKMMVEKPLTNFFNLLAQRMKEIK